MFCVNCGNQIEDESSFCPFCGTKLSAFDGNADSASEQHADPDRGLHDDRELTSAAQGEDVSASATQDETRNALAESAPQVDIESVSATTQNGAEVVAMPQVDDRPAPQAEAIPGSAPASPAAPQPEVSPVQPVVPVVSQPANSDRVSQPMREPQATSEAASGSKRGLIIAAVVVAIVAVGIIAAVVLSGLFGGAGEGDSNQEAIVDDGAVSGVSIKDKLGEYSWDEIEAIAQQIGIAETEENALEIARQYNLVDSSNKLSMTNSKSIQLNDGTSMSIWIAGFRHDDKSDGEGKAGITFMMSAPEAFHSMNPNETNAGGWEESSLRAWLSKEGLEMFPADVRDKIVSARKLTNNIGSTRNAHAVSVTSDKLWVPSATELFGSIDAYQGENAYCNSILNSEGARYQLFEDAGIVAAEKNQSLAMRFNEAACAWWLRSPLPSSETTFCTVNEYGSLATALSGGSYGVVAGFCMG